MTRTVRHYPMPDPDTMPVDYSDQDKRDAAAYVAAVAASEAEGVERVVNLLVLALAVVVACLWLSGRLG